VLNPYFLIAVGLAFLAVGGGGYYFGGKHARNAMEAQELREERLVAKITESTAEAIADIEIKNTTIRQKVETVTREVPVYRDCQHSPDVVRLLNSALEGGAIPSGNSVLSEANPAE